MLDTLQKVSYVVTPRCVRSLSLLRAFRSFLVFFRVHRNAAAWTPLNTRVCAHACRYVEGKLLELDLPVPGAGRFYARIDTAKCPLENSFASSRPLKGSMRHPFLCIRANAGHHQSFTFLPICWVIISFPFNLQGHLHLPPPALLRLLAADGQRQSAGGKMRSRPKWHISFSVGRVFTWVNVVHANCLVGLKGEEARSRSPLRGCVSQPRCAHALINAL